MSPRQAIAPLALIAALMVAGTGLSACSNSGLALTKSRTQGYDIPEDALQQIRPGVSRDFVEVVLGTPQTTNTIGEELGYYYVETKVQETAFGLSSVQERTVLAVYFDSSDRVADQAVYSLQDGKVFAVVPRRTPGYGTDETFVSAILGSFGNIPGFGG